MKATFLKRVMMAGLLASFCLPQSMMCQPDLDYDPYWDGYYQDEYYYDEYYEDEYCCDEYYYDDYDDGGWGFDFWFGGP